MTKDLEEFHSQGYGVAAAQAEGGDALLAIAAPQFIEERDEDAGTGSSDGMAEGDCSPVDVHLFGIQAELAGDGNGGYRKCFIEFEKVDILVAVPTGFGEQFFDRVDRSHHDPFGLETADGLRDDARDGFFAEAFGPALACDYDSGGPIIGAGGIAGSDGTIFLECGF